jgi:hypothetical protein
MDPLSNITVAYGALLQRERGQALDVRRGSRTDGSKTMQVYQTPCESSRQGRAMAAAANRAEWQHQRKQVAIQNERQISVPIAPEALKAATATSPAARASTSPGHNSVRCCTGGRRIASGLCCRSKLSQWWMLCRVGNMVSVVFVA